MNIDNIRQDAELWDEVRENHVREVKSLAGNREAIEKEELIPSYLKGKDIENDHMIAQLNDMLQRIQLEPEHHNLTMPVNENDQIINNIQNVRDQQKQQQLDLSECLDCIRKIQWKQSLAYQNRQGTIDLNDKGVT